MMVFVGGLLCYVVSVQMIAGYTENYLQTAPAELILTAADQNEENGLIVKKIDENLTLSCTLIGNNNITLPTENIEFSWMLPFQDANRSRIWTDGNTLKLSIDFVQPNDAGQYTCLAPAFPDLKANAYVAVRSASFLSIPYCSPSMFTCGDHVLEKAGAKCIPYTYLCDGRPDCPSPALDEAPETCGTNDPCIGKLRCGDGRCIPKHWCCQGLKNCIPHPCCAEHMHNEFPLEKTGGGLRKNPNEPILFQATLYKACACLLVIIITVTILISAICRARLKRITNIHGHMEVPTSESMNRHPCDDSPSVEDCHYSLICHNDGDLSYEGINQPSQFPPSYSDFINETNQQSINQTVCPNENVSNSPSLNQIHPVIPETEADTQNNSSEVERSNSAIVNSSPLRRPNDFGMSFIANAIFNSRYRPVPQQNVEIASVDYVTDSDSSCRSPTTRPPNQLNLDTVEFNSHFYGERIGGTPDVHFLRGLSENRRTRHANALDRILDRFGLNAPYNVDIDREYNRAPWEYQSFFGPDGIEQTPNRRGQFLSSFWTRLKERFVRPRPTDNVDGRTTNRSNCNADLLNISANVNRGRRRPDTPDVPELTFNDRNSRRLPGFLNENRRFELCGTTFAEISYFNQLVTRDLQLVPSHNFPPPYSQFATDPPPPYASRENLVSRANLRDANSSDQNGNLVVVNASSPSEIVEDTYNNNSNDININDAVIDSLVSVVPDTNITLTNPIVALNTCDDNGNVEQCAADISESQNIDNITNNNNRSFLNCNKCSDTIRCDKHKIIYNQLSVPSSSITEYSDLQDSSPKSEINSISSQNEDSSEENSQHSALDSNKASTSALPNSNSNISNNNGPATILETNRSSNINNNNEHLLETGLADENVQKTYDSNVLLKENVNVEDKLNKNILCHSMSNCENSTSDRISKSIFSDQNKIPSVPSESSILEESLRMTEECGLLFPPSNLEFIDSDSNLDQNVIGM